MFVGLLALAAVGCSRNYYNIPRDSFEKNVRVLGVAPIFLDAESDIKHPEKEALINLLREQSRASEKELVMMLRDGGAFYAVRPVEGDADQMFSRLFFRRERRDDADVRYNKYFFKEQEISDLIRQNQLDALMLIVISGLDRPEKIYSSNLLSYLNTDYNNIVMTAQILDASNTVLWEYPNFRQKSPDLPALVNLQYPDFDEAAANQDERVIVKFKTIPGLARALTKKKTSLTGNILPASGLYYDIFDDMASMLKPERTWFGEKKKAGPPADARQ
jgi:hypothetical protein